MDYRALLVKYVAHVVAAEGPTFADRADLISPSGMGEKAFTPEEIAELENSIFPEARAA